MVKWFYKWYGDILRYIESRDVKNWLGYGMMG